MALANYVKRCFLGHNAFRIISRRFYRPYNELDEFKPSSVDVVDKLLKRMFRRKEPTKTQPAIKGHDIWKLLEKSKTTKT